MKNFEGKVPISFSIYCSLAKVALFASEVRSKFASLVHLFLLLCWNLFSRSCSVADLRTHHFSWDNDCLVVDMSKQKGDQTGDKITPKHVYANPYNPEICIILALALHVFSISFRIDNDDKSKLFMGSPYDVFTKWLPTALIDIANLGYTITDFGTHSFRKGITTFCAGFIGGPSVIAIFLRAGWSLGQVQDRYITSSDGNDHLCGRVAAGLNFNAGSKFAVLPPHFANTNMLSAEEWNEIFPCYTEFPVGFQSCLPYFLASIAFHYNWLCERDNSGKLKHITEHHSIFVSRLWTSGVLQRLQNEVIGNITSGRCEVTGMTATGVPPHIELHREMEKLQKENEQLRSILLQHQAQLINELPTLVTENILSNIRVEGVQQLSKNDLEHMLTTILDRHSATCNAAAAPLNSEEELVASDDTKYGTWVWGGKFRPVPEGWLFPRGNVKSVCDLFITGIPEQNIRPLRLIQCHTLLRANQSYYTKAEYVFNLIVDWIGNELLCDSKTIYNMSLSEWDVQFKSIFTSIINCFQTYYKKQIRKPGELSIFTVYDMIVKYEKDVKK